MVKRGAEILFLLCLTARTSLAQPEAGARLVHLVRPQTLYVGQQAESMLELQTGKELSRPQFLDLSLEDFWQGTLENEPVREERHDGGVVRVLRMRRAIFPLTTGRLIIPPRRVRATVFQYKEEIRRPLGGLLSLKTITRVPEDVVLESNSVEVTSTNLPPLPNDASLWGLVNPLVGPTRITTSIGSTGARTGDSVRLRVEISSTGYLSPLASVPLDLGASVKIYPEQEESKEARVSGLVIFTKVFYLSLIPLEPGLLEIPRLRLTYFDPRRGRYEEATSGILSILVTGPAQRRLLPKPSEKEPVNTQQETEPSLARESLYQRLFTAIAPETLLMGLLGALVLAGIFLGRRRRPGVQEESSLAWPKEPEMLRRRAHEYCQNPELRAEALLLIDKLISEGRLPAEEDKVLRTLLQHSK